MNDGRAPHGARGLKYGGSATGGHAHHGRAPHGARGLKFFGRGSLLFSGLSRPARGAWIEIRFIGSFGPRCYRRAPHGAHGLKLHL